MAAVTICHCRCSGADFGGAQKIKSVTVSIVSPSICCEVMGPDAMIFIFLNVEFFTLLFHLHKRLFIF